MITCAAGADFLKSFFVVPTFFFRKEILACCSPDPYRGWLWGGGPPAAFSHPGGWTPPPPLPSFLFFSRMVGWMARLEAPAPHGFLAASPLGITPTDTRGHVPISSHHQSSMGGRMFRRLQPSYYNHHIFIPLFFYISIYFYSSSYFFFRRLQPRTFIPLVPATIQ